MALKKETPVKEQATAENVGRNVANKLTPAVVQSIVDAYSSGMTLGQACSLARVSTVAFQRYRRLNPEFTDTVWAEAVDLNTAALEERAHELAITATANSPTMLIFLLKARKPSVYRDNVQVNANVQVEFAASFATAMDRLLKNS